MPTTTNFGWTTPADTDLVKDGAAAIRTLGSNIDTSLVDLKGGTTGQYLQKNSGTDLDYVWADVSAGGMTLISTTTLTGTSVTLSSIPQTYNNLQLVIRDFRPNTDNRALLFRFNADSTASRHYRNDVYGDVGPVSYNLDSIRSYNSQTNAATGSFGVIQIPDYTNATTRKFATIITNTLNNANNANTSISNVLAMYNQTVAITSIQLLPETGNFLSGTALLYGVK